MLGYWVLGYRVSPRALDVGVLAVRTLGVGYWVLEYRMSEHWVLGYWVSARAPGVGVLTLYI